MKQRPGTAGARAARVVTGAGRVPAGTARVPPGTGRVRMSSAQRREQLIQVARTLFAERGFDGTSVEEIAQHADVSKPVVYEHFGGKQGLYAVVVDREVRTLLDTIRTALTTPGAGSRELIERGALALLDYIDSEPNGFRILVRDPVGSTGGSFGSILSDIAIRVEDLLAEPFERHGYDRSFSVIYAQALVGMVAMVGQSWLETREPPKQQVAAHLVNLAWNGMAHLDALPRLRLATPEPDDPGTDDPNPDDPGRPGKGRTGTA